MLGFLSDKSMLTAEPTVQSNKPMVQARIVLAGISTSKFRTDARTLNRVVRANFLFWLFSQRASRDTIRSAGMVAAHFWVWRIVLGKDLLDLGTLLDIDCVERYFDLVQFFQGQVRIQAMHLLKLLE